MKLKGTKAGIFSGILAVVLTALFVMVPASGRAEAEELPKEAGQQEPAIKQEPATKQEENKSSIREKASGGIEEIKERGVLVAGLPGEDLLAFYEEDEEGNLSGADVELARGIAASLGVDIVFSREAANNDELTKQLENGEIDIVAATYSRTLDRAQRVRLSEPYLSIGMAVMINKQAAVQRGVSQNPAGYLKTSGEKIAAIAGTSHVDLCRELFPTCEIVETGSYEEAAELVKNNEVFAYFCGELEFYSEICSDRELQIYTDVYVYSDIKDEFCVAVSKENEELQDYVNLYLAMSQRVTIDDIHERYDRYFGGEAQDEENK